MYKIVRVLICGKIQSKKEMSKEWTKDEPKKKGKRTESEARENCIWTREEHERKIKLNARETREKV